MRSVLRQRAFLRGLSRAQRRRWFEQFKVAQPRTSIGSLYLPAAVRHSFAYVVMR